MTTLDAKLKSGNPRLGIFIRLGLVPPARLWLGIGDCRAGIDADNGDGEIYSGLGEIINLPAFQQLINGVAERVEFKLSGVAQRAVQLAASEADDVKGVPLLVGLGVFDDDWQPVAQPTWLRRYTVDFLSIEQDSGPEGAVRTISLSCRSFLTARRRPGLSYFTDAEQQARSPGDRFCERAVHYSNDVIKVWPQY